MKFKELLVEKNLEGSMLKVLDNQLEIMFKTLKDNFLSKTNNYDDDVRLTNSFYKHIIKKIPILIEKYTDIDINFIKKLK